MKKILFLVVVSLMFAQVSYAGGTTYYKDKHGEKVEISPNSDGHLVTFESGQQDFYARGYSLGQIVSGLGLIGTTFKRGNASMSTK